MRDSYPNESHVYRQARRELANAEAALIEHVKEVARLRRTLPPGGKLKEDYLFTWATNERFGETVRFSELFRERSTLLLYSFMFGPNWDKPCPSCTSIVDGLDRMAPQVGKDAAIVVVGKASALRIREWAEVRSWNQIDLVSGDGCNYQQDYCCQDSDDRQFPKMNVFKKKGDEVLHFWGSEIATNDMDMFWPYWNLMDLTPEGRPNRPNPPQDFRSRYLEENYSVKEDS